MAALAVLNLALPRFLRWREELASLSLLNRQVFQVHAFFIALIVALFAALLLTSSNALLEPTQLSRAVLAGRYLQAEASHREPRSREVHRAPAGGGKVHGGVCLSNHESAVL